MRDHAHDDSENRNADTGYRREFFGDHTNDGCQNPDAGLRIALFRGTSWLSRAIRFQTRSVYSHAALVRDGEIVVEAWRRGVTCLDFPGERHRAGTQVDLFRVAGMSRDEEASAWGFAGRQLGCAYDFAGILGFLDRRRHPVEDRWFCSELVFAAYKHAGVRLLERIDACEVSPGLLAVSPLLELDRSLLIYHEDTKARREEAKKEHITTELKTFPPSFVSSCLRGAPLPSAINHLPSSP